MRMNELYMPAPTRNAAAFTVQTPRMRIIFMSTSSSDDRFSTATHTTSSTMPSRKSPMVRGSPQPHVEPGLIATSTATSHDDSSAGPTQLTRPGERTGDSGTKKKVALGEPTVGASGNQNSQW